jgi:hypothetical protein
MVGELVTLPLRVGVGATRLWLRGAGQAVSVAANVTEQVVDAVVGRTSVHAPAPRDVAPAADVWRPMEASPSEGRAYAEPPREAGHREPEPPRRPPEPESPPPTQDPPTPPVRIDVPGSPAHVSEGRELVEEFAERGAEDGAGAELHVQEPWRGYRELNAKQVIARLVAADPAELAAVQLYESRHRSRQKILTAVGRQLQNANGRGQG